MRSEGKSKVQLRLRMLVKRARRRLGAAPKRADRLDRLRRSATHESPTVIAARRAARLDGKPGKGKTKSANRRGM